MKKHWYDFLTGGETPEPTIDEYLTARAAEKDKLTQQLKQAIE